MNSSPSTNLMDSAHTSSKTISPGASIGMVGGGQLGRMFAMAASAMGYHVIAFCESDDSPTAQVADNVVVGKLDDAEAVERFAKQCDVITLEFENIPADTMKRCADIVPTYPAYRVLATAQDRLVEKSTLRDAGLRVTPFMQVHDQSSLLEAGKTLGWPVVVKTARDGYDGKGQFKINGPEDVSIVDWASAKHWIAEQWIHYRKEVSVVVAVSSNGESSTFPVFENDHQNHILDVSFAPADLAPALSERACDVATRAAEALGLVGLLCVEFFVVDDDVIINEVAPRPHNSAHLTIEGCHTSQFEQHVRAVCGLPLGSTDMRSEYAAMSNLLGDLWTSTGASETLDQAPCWEAALSDPSICLHLYGKGSAKVGRKMGHLTAVGENRQQVVQQVIAARERLLSQTSH